MCSREKLVLPSSCVGGVGVRRGGVKWLTRSIARLVKLQRGKGSQSPRDYLLVTPAAIIDASIANIRDQNCFDLWGTGVDIASMLTNIRAESVYQLQAAPTTITLLQPTLLVSGFTELELLPTGNVPLHYEITVGSSLNSQVATAATTATNFSTAWASTFDTRPTGYELFPGTSMLQNTAFWRNNVSGTMRATHYRTGRIEVGKQHKLVFAFKTRRFTFADYSSGNFLTTGGLIPNKSYRALMHVWGEPGQTCGVTGGATTSPTITELACPYLIRQRVHYFYKWVAGNNKASVYGSNLPTGITIPTGAYGYIGIPSVRAQRAALGYNASEFASGYPGYGGANVTRRQEAFLNMDQDCGSNPYPPSVSVI